MELDRLSLGVEPLDYLIPGGITRRSMVGVMGETGTGKSVILNEIAFRALQRGEKVLFILLEDVPIFRVLSLRAMGFDVEGHLDKGDLTFIDCFSFRLRVLDTEITREVSTNKGFFEVEDPRNPESVWEVIFERAKGMRGRGVVLMDSLTEFLTIAPDASVLLDMMKTAKALICRYYSIPFFYSFHFGLYDEFRFQIEIFSDGVIDLRFNPEVVNRELVKQIRVRRMSGCSHRTEWVTFNVERGKGLVMVR